MDKKEGFFIVTLIGILIGICIMACAIEYNNDTISLDALNEVCDRLVPGTVYVEETVGISSSFKCDYDYMNLKKPFKCIRCQKEFESLPAVGDVVIRCRKCKKADFVVSMKHGFAKGKEE